MRYTTGEVAVYELSAAVLMNQHGYNCYGSDGSFVRLAVTVQTLQLSMSLWDTWSSQKMVVYIYMCYSEMRERSGDSKRDKDRDVSQVRCVGSVTARWRHQHAVWGINDELCSLPWLLWKCKGEKSERGCKERCVSLLSCLTACCVLFKVLFRTQQFVVY